MKVEMIKGIKSWAVLNAHFEIHKQFSVFCFFQSCKGDLPLPESGYHKREEHSKFTVKTKVSGSWGGDRVCMCVCVCLRVCLCVYIHS